MAIRCVMWDCFNVLVPFDTPKFFNFLRMYRGNNRLPEDVFTGPGLELIRNHDLGRMSNEEFFNGIKKLYRLSNRITPELFFTWLGYILRPDLEMLAIRDGLRKRGVATVLVSNMNSFHFGYLKKHFPSFINGYDYRLVSCEEGIAKPNPEAWIRPLDILGLRAEECIFIDDSLPNVEAACRLGIKGWYYNSTDKNWCSTGKREQERRKLRHFLDLLWNEGIMRP
ncbi:MAG: HAD-IA family hydrolase [Candidatus Omnitrophota bacterium]|nr:HAD-IA family hydrolase [Candidatus Omnitrophota bacterium]